MRSAIVGLDSAFWPDAFPRAVRSHPHGQVDVCCDLGLDPAVVQNDLVVTVDDFVSERNLKLTRSIDELLEHDFEAAFICTRNSVMPSVGERLLDAGKHLFVAKPMALSSAEARRYLGGETRGLVVTAGQTASRWSPYPTLLRLVGEQTIGDLITMRAVHQHGHYSAFPEHLWYTDPEEGDLHNWLGWYPVEAIVTVMGPIARVTGVARQAASSHGTLPDHCAALFELVDGRHATASVYFTIGAWGMPMHEGELVGTGGVARFHGPSQTVQLLREGGEEQVPLDEGPDGLATEVDDFFSAIAGRGSPALRVGDAVHVAEVCAAWRESSAAGRPVDVPAHPAPERLGVV